MAGVPYTKEQLDWLRDNYEVYPDSNAITKAFNETFQCCRSRHAIRIALTRNCGLKRAVHQQYTPEENAWLIENYPKVKSTDLAKLFGEKFGHKVAPRSLITHCNSRLHIVSGRQSYEKGGVPFNVVPVGAERTTKQGYIMVKVGNKKSKKGDSATYHDNWKFKHVLIWEQHHGKIPPSHTIIFLDGNRANCDISNLYCAHKKIFALMNRNAWCTDKPDLTLAAIKCCELHFAIKEVYTIGE